MSKNRNASARNAVTLDQPMTVKPPVIEVVKSVTPVTEASVTAVESPVITDVLCVASGEWSRDEYSGNITVTAVIATRDAQGTYTLTRRAGDMCVSKFDPTLKRIVIEGFVSVRNEAGIWLDTVHDTYLLNTKNEPIKRASQAYAHLMREWVKGKTFASTPTTRTSAVKKLTETVALKDASIEALQRERDDATAKYEALLARLTALENASKIAESQHDNTLTVGI